MGVIEEVCLLIGRDGSVLWADRSGDPVALPDSRARWEAIWRHRERLAEISHSHPSGGLRFSAEDETTMAALDEALGRPLRYSVVTATGMITREPAGSRARAGPRESGRRAEPWWVDLLRAASGIAPAAEHPTDQSADTGSE